MTPHRLPAWFLAATLCAFVGGLPCVGWAQPAGAARLGTLQFPNTDVKAVLREYERLTGKVVIMDNTVNGNVYIVVDEELSAAERVKIIETNLLMNGYSIIPSGGRTVKVVGSSAKPTTEGVPIYTDVDQLPSTDLIVSFFHRLQFLDAESVRDQITAYIPFSPEDPSAQGVTAFPESQTLLITGSTTVVRSAMQIIEAIDQPPAKVVSVFIPLQRASALKVFEQLQEIFEEEGGSPSNAQQRAAARQRAAQQGQQGGQPAPPASGGSNTLTVSEDSFVQGRLKIVADERTNRIHVITREVNLPFIRSLIDQLDAAHSFGTPQRFILKFARAGELLPVLVEALTEPGTEAGEVVSADETTGAAAGGGQGGGSLGGTSGSGISFEELLEVEAVEVTPLAVTVGNTRLIADRANNAIVVLGTEQAKQTVRQVLSELDIRSPQVMFNVVIGEMELRKGEEWGIDLLLRLFNGGFVGANDTITGNPSFQDSSGDDGADLAFPITDAASIFTPIVQGVGASTGLTAFFAFGNTVAGFVHALESTNRFRTISRPTIFTKNNQKAIIASGQEVAVPVSSTSTFTGDATPLTSSNIEFKPIVLQLEVVPLINADGEISLDILQKIDNISGSTEIDGNSIPTIATRVIRTNVDVPDGATVFLGGLIIDDETRGSNGLPGLSRIPVLGFLFGGFNKSQVRRELIIMISPTVVREPDGLEVARDIIGRDYILPTDIEMELVPAEKYVEHSDLIPMDNPFPKPALEAIQDGEATPEEFGWRWAKPPIPPTAEMSAEAEAATAPTIEEAAGTKSRGPSRRLPPRPIAPAEGPVLQEQREVSTTPPPTEGGLRQDDDPTLIAPRRTVEEQRKLQAVPGQVPDEVEPVFVEPHEQTSP